jgi:hypothetical protein
MSLSPETTYEYHFRDPYLYYCKEHECLRVTDSHEDSVLLSGLSEKDLDTFIEHYNKYVKEKGECTNVED